jgi:hypothetical protein
MRSRRSQRASSLRFRLPLFQWLLRRAWPRAKGGVRIDEATKNAPGEPAGIVHHRKKGRNEKQPREGLKVPDKQPKRGRLWLTDGSCIRLRPQQRNHVWSYDFVEDRTHDGRRYRMLNVLDEFTHECLAIRVARKLKGAT